MGNSFELDTTTLDVTVPVGTHLVVRFDEHGSVGQTSDVTVGDVTVLQLGERHVDYQSPERVAAGMTGADAASVTVPLEALAPGRSTVTRTDDYRGQTQNVYEWTVTVTAETQAP